MREAHATEIWREVFIRAGTSSLSPLIPAPGFEVQVALCLSDLSICLPLKSAGPPAMHSLEFTRCVIYSALVF